MVSPIGQLCIQHGRVQPIALPVRKIRILNLQRSTINRTTASHRPIVFNQFAEENPQRPTIRHDVVEDHEKHVRWHGLGDVPYNTEPHEKILGEIEREVLFCYPYILKITLITDLFHPNTQGPETPDSL